MMQCCRLFMVQKFMCWKLNPQIMCCWTEKGALGRSLGLDEDRRMGPHGGIGDCKKRKRDPS